LDGKNENLRVAACSQVFDKGVFIKGVHLKVSFNIGIVIVDSLCYHSVFDGGIIPKEDKKLVNNEIIASMLVGDP
jgi:hypothetical protein